MGIGYEKRSEDSPELRWKLDEGMKGEPEKMERENIGVEEDGECECYGC